MNLTYRSIADVERKSPHFQLLSLVNQQNHRQVDRLAGSSACYLRFSFNSPRHGRSDFRCFL